MNELLKLYRKCRNTESNFLVCVLFYFWYKLQNKDILRHHKTVIKGINNIQTSGLLQIGTTQVGFSSRNDLTLLNVSGKLTVKGSFTIGRGCRLDIGKDAIVTLGKGGFINPFSKIIIQHGLEIGENCYISWDCQFLDEDFHSIDYPGKNNSHKDRRIYIGDHVWIGSNVTVLKGSKIANGSVVAANSLVNSTFTDENVLLAGNPARIIKRDITWS